MNLIPGLNDDLGRECLIRIPSDSFPSTFEVCRAWNHELQSRDFHSRRSLLGLTRPVFVLAQADPVQSQRTGVRRYWLNVFYPKSGSWTRLPCPPGLTRGLPLFCGLVGVGSKIIVIGGWDPESWVASKEVYVFDFLNGQWRRGSDMPGPARSLFGVAGDPVRRTVVVAGGHGDEKIALRSSLMYDVEGDKWVALGDMDKARDECNIVFHGGTFHVISGYDTDKQGCFSNCAESLDMQTWQWGPANGVFVEASARAGSSWVTWNGDDKLYGRVGDDVVLQCGGGEKWEAVTKVPHEIRISQRVTMCRDKMFMTGCHVYGGPIHAYVLDLDSREWSKVDMPEYAGHAQSICALEL